MLADGLSGCSKCCQPLQLIDCIGERKLGLGGFIHIICKNPVCSHKNVVPYGKRHTVQKDSQASCKKTPMAWDANSKLALGRCSFLLFVAR